MPEYQVYLEQSNRTIIIALREANEPAPAFKAFVGRHLANNLDEARDYILKRGIPAIMFPAPPFRPEGPPGRSDD